jgi:hypothetical protein
MQDSPVQHASREAAPFSVTVTSTAWRAAAEAWVADAVGRLGGAVSAVEQPRVRPWSSQFVVGSSAGRFWFKAGCRAQAFEPALQDLLGRLVPADVDRPVAADPHRGWMLTADRGATLHEDHQPTPDDWAAVVGTWARVQRAVAGHRADVLATGVPDCSPTTVPARFDRMLGVLRALPAGHPARPDDGLAARLAAARPRVEAAARHLAADPLPVTLQHGDLHPGNVFATPGGLRLFDLGDAQWAHAAEALAVPCAVMAAAGLDPRAAVDAFRAAWRAPGSDPHTDPGWDATRRAARVTQAVNRADTWWRCLEQATEAETADWGEAPLRHLSRVLEVEDVADVADEG